MDPEQQRSILPLEGDRLQQDAAPLHRPPDRAHLRIPGGTVIVSISRIIVNSQELNPPF